MWAFGKTMTGSELRYLTKGRQLQVNNETIRGNYDLVIQRKLWHKDCKTWKGVARLLNEWEVTDQVREQIRHMKRDEIMVIPLNVAAFIDE